MWAFSVPIHVLMKLLQAQSRLVWPAVSRSGPAALIGLFSIQLAAQKLSVQYHLSTSEEKVEHFYELHVCTDQTTGLNNWLFCLRQRDIVWENEQGGGLSQRNATDTLKQRDWDRAYYLTSLHKNILHAQRARWKGDWLQCSVMMTCGQLGDLKTWQWRTGFTITIDSAPD